jgi:hypothetical protein
MVDQLFLGEPNLDLADKSLVENAKNILRSIDASHPVPQISFGDEEIGFTWIRNSNRVEFLLKSDGYAVWFAEFDGEIQDGDEVLIDGTFPESASEMLSRLYSL